MASTSEEERLLEPLERAHRALLLVDVVESVRLIEQDESDFVVRWLRLLAEVKSNILPLHGGRLVKNLGDGMLIDFANVPSAVAAAFAIQNESARRNAGVQPERMILLRMGIEASSVIVDDGDVLGQGVNLAARLMTLGGPGEIVISAGARDQLTPHLDADVEDLGDCYLRHLREPVRAYRLWAAGGAADDRIADRPR